MLTLLDLQKDFGQLEHQIVQLCSIFEANRQVIKKDLEIMTNRLVVLEEAMAQLVDELIEAEILEEEDDVKSRAN